MPLVAQVLSDGLVQLDAVPPSNVQATAQKWFDAWWAYAQNMTFLIPGGSGRALVQGAFIATLSGALSPGSAAGPFFSGLENAMRGAWGTLGTPVGLLPPALSATPAPAPLAPTLDSIVGIGMASQQKAPPRVQLATLIDTWTKTYIVIGPLGPLGPFS